MGVLAITDVNNLHDTILGNIERIKEDEYRDEDSKNYLSDSITIPHGRTLQMYLNLKQTTYSASMNILTKRASEFEGFQERVKKEINDQTHYKVYQLSDNILRLRHINDNFWSYGIALMPSKDDASLHVTMGASGLLVRNAAKKQDFVKAIEDLEMIANITFEPFLAKEGIPKDMLYYLNPL